MKRILLLLLAMLLSLPQMQAQKVIGGTCGKDVVWKFDGKTLTVSNNSKKGYVAIENYNTKNHKAPWLRQGLDVRNIRIGHGITAIGSCAFANLINLNEVVFESNNLVDIEWGAFYNCVRLSSISLPYTVRKVATIAFANCRTLNSIKIPDQCHVQDQAFLNCTSMSAVEISPTATLGQYVFANEVTVDGKVRHTLYNKEVNNLPGYINSGNCHHYGFAKDIVERFRSEKKNGKDIDYDYITSEVDEDVPYNNIAMRYDLYALIIGNENYRFVPDVPYAIHDARVFREYCEKTLSIPAENIHICEDATKQLILDDEFGWVESIPEREDKSLIVYYAGHGVPDVQDHNKAYLLPTDVRGTKPKNGILLDDFYGRLGEMGFRQTTVFLDACFSGITRDNESVNEGMRGVEIEAEEGKLSTGNIVVFSAAQGNETAQSFNEQGHGLFTYYLLKNLQDTNATSNFGELSDYLRSNVRLRALQFKQRKPQTPVTSASSAFEHTWRGLTF